MEEKQKDETQSQIVVSVSPHIHKNISIKRIMFTVSAILLLPLGWSMYIYGGYVVIIAIVSCISAFLAEAFVRGIMKRKVTVFDGSALLTGLLLACNLPPGVPLWIPAIGSMFAIIVGKQVFGGLGYNFINPALAGRAFLVASWPKIMTHSWVTPLLGTKSAISSITTATPLSLIKTVESTSQLSYEINSNASITNLFFGKCGGCIGEVSAFILLCGGIFLIAIKYIDWRIPVSYIGTVGILTEIFYLSGFTMGDGIFHMLTGGLFLGAFFMATDYVTSPITKSGRWVFGIGCGIITVLIRLWSNYPEGVCFSILLMNCVVPLINRSKMPKRFGAK